MADPGKKTVPIPKVAAVEKCLRFLCCFTPLQQEFSLTRLSNIMDLADAEKLEDGS